MGSSVGCPYFLKIFFQNLFDRPNLSKSSSIFKVHLKPGPISKMELFLQN